MTEVVVVDALLGLFARNLMDTPQGLFSCFIARVEPFGFRPMSVAFATFTSSTPFSYPAPGSCIIISYSSRFRTFK